tara:strand:- start:75 stop:317 length:243 start_codon:yes stop_codon:yes gene_type:complete
MESAPYGLNSPTSQPIPGSASPGATSSDWQEFNRNKFSFAESFIVLNPFVSLKIEAQDPKENLFFIKVNKMIATSIQDEQ